MDIEELKNLIVSELEERKAENIKILDVRSSGIANYMIFASGRSVKNVSSIADVVSTNIKNKTGLSVGLDGLRNSNWAILDLGAIIVHIFHPDTRKYYNVEEIFELSTNKAD
jgi:ribosome-associated protein